MTNTNTLPSSADEAVQRNPLLLARHLLAGPTVYRDPVTGLACIGHYRAACDILADTTTYSSRNPMIFSRTCSPIADEVHASLKARGFLPVDTLVTNDPPGHRHYRRIVERIFSPAVVRRLEGDIRAIGDELLDDMLRSDKAEVMGSLALKLPIYFILGQLGVSRDDYAKVKHWADISIERISPVIPPVHERELTEAVIAMQRYIWTHLQRAKASGADTLLGLLARAGDGDEALSPEELVNMATQIFVAGHETSTALIGHAILLLIEQPELRARLIAEPALIGAFIEEVLRLHPPVGALRIATRDVTLDGHVIKAGEMVALNVMAANRDPKMFYNPDAVDLSRANASQHLSFGKGIHYCIGNMVARAEARVAIEGLLARAPRFRLDTQAPPPRYAAVYHAHVLERLSVCFG